MSVEKVIASLFKMDDRTWRRHTNPRSVYSRFSLIPLLIPAFWSRIWLGWWSALPIAIVFIWMWLNPRVFPEPKSTNNWASKVVLGERVWLNRKTIPVPAHHKVMPNILSAGSSIGIIPFVWGLVVLDIWMTAFGGMLIFISKVWFADRMVWLFEDMKEFIDEYRSWLY